MYFLVSIPQAVSAIAIQQEGIDTNSVDLNEVSIPQAVSAIAIAKNIEPPIGHGRRVSIPQAVSAIAMLQQE